MALRTVIPPKHGRPSNKPAKGKYRRLMQTRFDEACYRKRSQVETVMSMIKRRQGSFCKGKTYWSRCRELHLMVLTHNIMILLPRGTFLQSRTGLIVREASTMSPVPFVCFVKIEPRPLFFPVPFSFLLLFDTFSRSLAPCLLTSQDSYECWDIPEVNCFT